MVVPAVVFDMDGVLLNSEEVWHRARRDFVGAQGGTWDVEDQRACMGANSRQWSTYIRFHFAVPRSPQDICRGVVDMLRLQYERHLPVIPGAVAAVRELAGRYSLAVASSSPLELIEFLVGRMGLRDAFGVLVSSDDVQRGKPHPDVYLLACERLGVVPSHAAAVEDSSNGILAAAAAGLRVVAVPNHVFPPSAESLSKAAVVLDHISLLAPALVDSLLQEERSAGE